MVYISVAGSQYVDKEKIQRHPIQYLYILPKTMQSLSSAAAAAVHKMADTVGAGDPLQAKIEEWARDCKEKRCCAIGIDNYLQETLSEPDYYIQS
ncbi:hypothetical protein Pelo_8227, partial [Pelomyxa schiedti]